MKNRGVLISFLQPFPGGQGQIVSLIAEQRNFNSEEEEEGSLRQAIMYDYINKSNEKQRLQSNRSSMESKLSIPCYISSSLSNSRMIRYGNAVG